MPFHGQIAAASLSMNVGAEQGFGTSCGLFAGLVPAIVRFEIAGPRSARFNVRLPCEHNATSDSFLSTRPIGCKRSCCCTRLLHL
jgi:hypothetical protein